MAASTKTRKSIPPPRTPKPRPVAAPVVPPAPSSALDAALLNQAAVMGALEQVLRRLDDQARQLADIRRGLGGGRPLEDAETAPAPSARREFPHGALADPAVMAALAGRAQTTLVFVGAPRPLGEAGAALRSGAQVMVCEPSALRCEGVSRSGVTAKNILLGAKAGMVGFDPVAGEIFDDQDAAMVVPVARLDEVLPRGARAVLLAKQKSLAAAALSGAERTKVAAVALRGDDTSSPDRLRWPAGLIVRDEPGSARSTVLWFAGPRDRASLLDWCRAELPSSQFSLL